MYNNIPQLHIRDSLSNQTYLLFFAGIAVFVLVYCIFSIIACKIRIRKLDTILSMIEKDKRKLDNYMYFSNKDNKEAVNTSAQTSVEDRTFLFS